jgi:hypothetical protein
MGKRSIPSLLMIGTVHRDPRGKAKLNRLLQREKPAFISVEISPYSRIFRAQKAAAFRAILRENLKSIQKEEGNPWREIFSHSEIRGIFFLLREPYEWQAAEAYAGQSGSSVEEIDLSLYSQEKLSHLSDLVSLENLRTLLRIPFPDLTEQVATQYRRASFLFSHPPSIWPRNSEVKKRESFMAEKIRSLVHRARGEKMLHVGGWEHLIEFPGGESLYDLLRDLGPQRVLLSDGGNS